MAKTADTIAIYSRKSRYTGKGESIGNQIDLCREYIRTHYGDAAAEHAVVFEDEGFSGGNLNRPDFKKMMTAAKDRKFKAIVVYRLDRISRNISDFSSLIEELGRLGIKKQTPGVRSPGFPSGRFCRILSTSLQTRTPISILWTTRQSCSPRSPILTAFPPKVRKKGKPSFIN